MEDSDLMSAKWWPWARHRGRHVTHIISSPIRALRNSLRHVPRAASVRTLLSTQSHSFTCSFMQQIFYWICLMCLTLFWKLPNECAFSGLPLEAGADGAPGCTQPPPGLRCNRQTSSPSKSASGQSWGRMEQVICQWS